MGKLVLHVLGEPEHGVEDVSGQVMLAILRAEKLGDRE